MKPEFKLNRTPPNDNDSNPKQNFNTLLERFKSESLKKAKQQKHFKTSLRYTAVLAGITVVCVISLSVIQNSSKNISGLSNSVSGIVVQKPKSLSALETKRKVNRKRYTVSNAKGGTVIHTDGTRIEIPKHAFVKAKGKTLDTLVSFEFETFVGARDIMFSGIGMNCDSAGIERRFESAGMFEIRACDSSISIHPERPLQVHMPSHQTSSKFRSYYSANRGQLWSSISEYQAENSVPSASTASRSKHPNFTDAHVAANPLQKPLIPQIWNAQTDYLKLQINTSDFPELKAFNDLLFMADSRYNAANPEWYTVSWADIKIEPGPDSACNYKLTLRYRNRIETLIALPVYKGKDAERALARYQDALKTYQSAIQNHKQQLENENNQRASAQRKQQYDWKQAQAEQVKAYNAARTDSKTKLIRAFYVKQFGVYNSDYPHEQTFNTSIIPDFLIQNVKINPDFAFAIDLKRRCVMQLNQTQKFRFAYDSESAYAFCVVSENRVYWCRQQDAMLMLKPGNCNITVTEVSNSELEQFDNVFFM